MSLPLSSYVALADKLRAGETSPSQELEACLKRIAATEPTVKAFVHFAYDAAREAASASDARWRAGQPLSAVDGMVIGVKDIIETRDMPTGQGSPFWKDNHTRRDSASVQALREAGAIIIGKTTTTEYASMQPYAPTTNPHDATRTPGGSSSGSAAAVGAGMIPAALGTQVVGSTLRPASFSGCVGFKPTVGALNRGGSYDHLSHSCHGILAASPADAWVVASAIAERVGGDPGHLGLQGPSAPPAATAPKRLVVLETSGWSKTSEGARTAFAQTKDKLASLGVTLADRRDDADIDAFEHAITDIVALTFRIFDWEWRWPMATFVTMPGAVSDLMRKRLDDARAMTVADYHHALEERDALRTQYDRLLAGYDAVVTLGALGAAPKGLGATGDPAMNVPASLLGIPAMSLPLLSDEGLPLGLQLMGRRHEDAGLLSIAAWTWSEF